MTLLSEVARDVAEALELTPICFNGQWSWWIAKQPEDVPALSQDGSNLTDPYWRCACEDWLHEHRRYVAYRLDADGNIDGPQPDMPARTLSAVWRRMKEKE